MGDVVILVVAVGWGALEGLLNLLRTQRRGAESHDRGTRLVVIIAATVGVILSTGAAGLLPGMRLPGTRPVLLGMVVMILGLLFRLWAILTLGSLFTTEVMVNTGQAVIEHGPYRFVRHPSYTGVVLAMVGLGMAEWNVASLLLGVAVPLVALVRRIGVEERVLTEFLGEPYLRYCRGRARLLPGIW